MRVAAGLPRSARDTGSREIVEKDDGPAFDGEIGGVRAASRCSPRGGDRRESAGARAVSASP
ncbi:hypothetical protein WMF11_38715 [Sorangium sp. So ce295]|jgi:hypothetical protein|uniref:hypothetical protein n=1 Tax=Sorangium sp. So ce295 TaxID=3133295 RepID=UPI003F600452